jgi:transcriptional regulator with XRE-family HTH domain
MDEKPTDLQRRLGDNLQRLRHEAGLSQEDLASNAGLDRTFISGCERYIRNPSITTLERLAKGLGVDPSQLLEPNK